MLAKTHDSYFKTLIEKVPMQLERQWGWIATAICISIMLYVVNPTEYIMQNLHQLGYVGAFFIMMFSNATIFLPLPGLTVVAALATTLNPIYLGIAAGIGGGIGETTGYMFGRGSEKAIMKRNPKYYGKVKGWMQRHGEMALVVLSAIPNPAFDIAGVAAGALRYEWWKFLLSVILGNIIKAIFIAYSTKYSIDFFSWIIGF